MKKALKRLVDDLNWHGLTELYEYVELERYKKVTVGLDSGCDMDSWVYDMYWAILGLKGKWNHSRYCFLDRHRHKLRSYGSVCSEGMVIDHYYLKAHPNEQEDE